MCEVVGGKKQEGLENVALWEFNPRGSRRARGIESTVVEQGRVLGRKDLRGTKKRGGMGLWGLHFVNGENSGPIDR